MVHNDEKNYLIHVCTSFFKNTSSIKTRLPLMKLFTYLKPTSLSHLET